MKRWVIFVTLFKPDFAFGFNLQTTPQNLVRRRHFRHEQQILCGSPTDEYPSVKNPSQLQSRATFKPDGTAVMSRTQPQTGTARMTRECTVAPVNTAVLGILMSASLFLLLGTEVQTEAERFLADNSLSVTDAVLDLCARFPGDWLSWYDREALAFPVMTKACTSGACYFAGDLLAQALRPDVVGPESLDLTRTLRSGAAGFVGHGPVAHYWLHFLDGPALSFGGAWWAYFPKVVADQGPMSVVYNTAYTVLIGLFSLRSPKAVWADVQDTWLPGVLVSLRFWPLVHLVTFSTLVPPELKVLWVDAMEIIWVAILSRVNNEGKVLQGGQAEGQE